MGFLKRSIIIAASVATAAASANDTNGSSNTTTGADLESCTRAEDLMWRSLDDKTVTADDTDVKQVVLCLAAEFSHAANEKGIDVKNVDIKEILTECGGPDLAQVSLDGLNMTTKPLPSMPASATVDLGNTTRGHRCREVH